MRRNGGRTRLRLRALVLALAGLAASAAPVHGSDIIVGFTWYADGTYVKSGPAGTVITAYATQTLANRPFELVAAPVREGFLPCFRLFATVLNPNVRMSSTTGFIGNTSGRINQPAGNYQICFLEVRQDNPDAATAPVHFTIL